MIRRPLPIALVLAAALAAAAAPAAQTPAASTPAAPGATAPAPALDESKRVKTEDIDAVLAKAGVVLLDVREASELEELGTIQGAIHIPLGQLGSRLGELPKDKTILTTCQRGRRAAQATTILEANGFKTAGFCGLLDYKGPRVYPKAPASKS